MPTLRLSLSDNNMSKKMTVSNLRTSPFIRYRQNRLSRRLLLYIVISSTFFTMLTTGFQLYMEYARYRSEVYESIRFIKESYIKPVADNAFRLNKPTALNLLGGILKLQGIVYTEIIEKETDGTRFVWLSKGDPNAEMDIMEEFPLMYEDSDNNTDFFGILNVFATMKSVNQRLQERILIILISNAVKTFVASLCILFIIQFTVTRHLISIADYTKKLDLNKTDQIMLNLIKAESSEPDELDSVVTAINEMRFRIKQDMAAQKWAQEKLRESEEFLRRAHDRLEGEVIRRTAELVAVNEQLKNEIKHRRRTEDALKKSEIRLNEAQQIAHVGSYERNTLTGEGYWSDEYYRIFGYESGAVPCSQAFFYEHVHPEDREDVVENIETVVANKTSYEFRFRFIRKDGEIRFGYTIGKIKADGHGHPVILSGTLQDITARVKMEAMLQEKQAQIAHAGRLASLGEMASGIAHELNQPLSIIRLNAEGLKFSLKRNGGLLPRYENDLKAVMTGVDRASDIIEHMRGYARTNGSDCEYICLSEPVHNALMFFKEQFRNHEIALETHYEENLPKVFVSSQRFEQVAVNLLSNARYAVDKQKETASESWQKKIVLRILYDKIRNAVVFEVTDNGIGMDSEEQKRCPEPFFTTKEVGEGTGLGLSIVHGIIKDFKGSLEIESEKGLGTTMRVVIGV